MATIRRISDMFGDLDLGPAPPSAVVAPVVAPLKTVMVEQEVVDLDVSMFDLDALMQQSRKWKNAFAVEQMVEAVYVEDGLWYTARIDVVLDEPGRYRLTFTDYGNEQETEETQIRLPLAEVMKQKELELAAAVAKETEKKAKRRGSLLVHNSPEARPSKPPVPTAVSTATTSAVAPSVPPMGLVKRTSMGNMSSMFDQLVSDQPLPPPPTSVMQSGAMSAEERKALIMAEARKLGMDSRGERRTVEVGKTSLSDRHLEEKRKDEVDKKRGNRSNSFSTSSSSAPVSASVSSAAMVGDLGALLEAEETRRRSASQSAPAESERKVWASNPLSM